jgi:hypothetical protein
MRFLLASLLVGATFFRAQPGAAQQFLDLFATRPRMLNLQSVVPVHAFAISLSRLLQIGNFDYELPKSSS